MAVLEHQKCIISPFSRPEVQKIRVLAACSLWRCQGRIYSGPLSHLPGSSLACGGVIPTSTWHSPKWPQAGRVSFSNPIGPHAGYSPTHPLTSQICPLHSLPRLAMILAVATFLCLKVVLKGSSFTYQLSVTIPTFTSFILWIIPSLNSPQFNPLSCHEPGSMTPPQDAWGVLG